MKLINSNYIKSNNKIKLLMNIIRWTVVPKMFILVYMLAFLFFVTYMEIEASSDIITVFAGQTIPVVFFFILMPTLYLILFEKVSLNELGLHYKFSFTSIGIIVFCTFGLLYIVIKLINGGHFSQEIAYIIHFAFIGLAEEILCRGILFYELEKVFTRHLVVIISALIFAFIFHSAGDMMANLYWRFPLGLLFGYIYLYTKNIYASILLHWIINVFVTTHHLY